MDEKPELTEEDKTKLLEAYKQATSLLKKIVKYSAVPGQKHIDLGLAAAQERPVYQKALLTVHQCKYEGLVTEEEFQQQIGLV